VSHSYYLCDAFAERPGEGNPAVVVPCRAFPEEAQMRAIAGELNAWTAFLSRESDGWATRIFSLPPVVESPLCGHALLSAATTVFERLEPETNEAILRTPAMDVEVGRLEKGIYSISLPQIVTVKAEKKELPERVIEGLGGLPTEVWRRQTGYPAWILLYGTPDDVRALPRPPAALAGLETLLLATAPAEEADFVSRLFQPMKSLLEDSAGGTQHALAGPFWSRRLGKSRLDARALSPRGGRCRLTVGAGRVEIEAPALLVGEGRLLSPLVAAAALR